MEDYRWSLERSDVADFLNGWAAGQASALVVWAIHTASGLVYLRSLDQQMRSAERWPEQWQAVNVSHARWASISAITTLDLAAGALARLHRLPRKRGGREYSFRDFFGKTGTDLRERLPLAGRRWLETTWKDAEYKTLWRARNPFTHGTLGMSATVTLGGPTPARFSFRVGPNGEELESAELVALALRVADRQLSAFVSGLQDGSLL